MASEGAKSHRPRDQRQKDFDFLIKKMHENPDLSGKVYHELLLEDIKARGEDYVVTHAQVCRDIVQIKKNVVANIGVNLKSKALDSLATLEYLMSVTMDQLEIRINQDRKTEEIVVEDLQVQNLSDLDEDEKALYFKMRHKMRKTSRRTTIIPAGSDIKEMVLTIAKVNEDIRKLLGLDAPKKVDTRNTHIHQIEQMTSQDLVDKFKMLGINNKEKMAAFFESISFTPTKKLKGKQNSD